MKPGVLGLTCRTRAGPRNFPCMNPIPADTPYPGQNWRGVPGCTVVVKHENHTPTGAFKLRRPSSIGPLVASAGRRTGIVPAPRGNPPVYRHSASSRGFPATILFLTGNSPDQNFPRCAASGRSLIETGRDVDEAKHAAQRRAADGLHFVPSSPRPGGRRRQLAVWNSCAPCRRC